MVSPILSPDDQHRIEQAVVAAERRTTGEIVCVLTREVSTYPEVPIAAGAVAALVPPAVALAVGADPDLLLRLAGAWRAGHVAAAEAQVETALTVALIVQMVLFALATGLAALPPIRRALTPWGLKRTRVRQAADQQFLATGLAMSAQRTGVVIFTSLEDRQVEIVADQAIHAACGDAVWKAAVGAVQNGMRAGDPARGMVRAIEICGQALADHFPSEGGGENTLADRVLEL